MVGPRESQLAHVFDDSALAEVRWTCDERAPTPVRGRLRIERTETRQLDGLLADETLDAVAVAAPAHSRPALVRQALEADKHVYVEGPLSGRADETLALMRLAERRRLRLLVGHVLLFDPGVRKLKELIEIGRLGEVYYLTATVTTAQRSTGDESILASAGADALATILHLLGDEPISASAVSDSYVDPAALEVAICNLRFATGITASLELSWLDAREQCRICVVGSRRTAVFDASKPLRKVTIYERETPRGAEIVCPRVAPGDPLRLQCETFLTGIRSSIEYPTTRIAPGVARVLEAFAGEGRAAAPVARSAPRSRLRLAETEWKEGASLSTKQR